MEPTIQKLAIAVTFHFSSARLIYLKTIAKHFHTLANEVMVYIITNDTLPHNISCIHDCLSDCACRYEIIVPSYIGHPFLLTWGHFGVFRKIVDTDTATSHFLYLEDDILVKKENITYWLQGRQHLSPYGLIPSFVRYEENDSISYCTDIIKPINPKTAASITVKADYSYICPKTPYQGMYLLDRDLMKEFLESPQSNPEVGKWGIREKAAQGITFVNVPEGFGSRNVIGYITNLGIADPNCFIHHTPNNYATDPTTAFGTLPTSQLFNKKHLATKEYPHVHYDLTQLNYKKNFVESLKILSNQLLS